MNTPHPHRSPLAPRAARHLSAFLAINLGAAQAVQLYGASGPPGSITPYQVAARR